MTRQRISTTHDFRQRIGSAAVFYLLRSDWMAFPRCGELERRFSAARRSLWLTVAFYAPASLMLDSGNPLFDVLDRAVDRRLDRPAAESRSQNERGKSRLRREGCPSTWRPTVTRPA